MYRTRIKFHGLIFCVFDWQKNLWGINFRGHGGMVGTIVVRLAKYASYCVLIFVDKRHTTKSTKIYMPQKFLRVRYVQNSLLLFDIFTFPIQLLIYVISEIIQFSLLTEGSPLAVDDDLGMFRLVSSVFGDVPGLLHVACISASAQYEADVTIWVNPAKCHLSTSCVIHQCHHINVAYLK